MTPTFKDLVRMDVKNNVTDVELSQLEADPVLWRDELLLLLQEADQQFTAKRAEAPAATLPPEEFRKVRKEYLGWRRGATAWKTRICDRLRDVKAMVKAKNIADSAKENAERDNFKAQVLEEMKRQSALLQDIRDSLRGGPGYDPNNSAAPRKR